MNKLDKLEKKKKVKALKAIIKACRKFEREEELKNKTGWTAVHRVVKSDKTYNRKYKHKKQIK